MARWTGTWLAGTSSGPEDGARPRWAGEHLRLPEEGVGSAATGGRRTLGLLVDWLIAALVASIFVPPPAAELAMTGQDVGELGYQYHLTAILVWLLLSVPPQAIFGFTPGMGAVGVRVGRLDGASAPGWWRALVRWALTALLVPAWLRNRDGRGLHDRATGTVVVRMR